MKRQRSEITVTINMVMRAATYGCSEETNSHIPGDRRLKPEARGDEDGDAEGDHDEEGDSVHFLVVVLVVVVVVVVASLLKGSVSSWSFGSVQRLAPPPVRAGAGGRGVGGTATACARPASANARAA
jgi:hypothetical protein